MGFNTDQIGWASTPIRSDGFQQRWRSSRLKQDSI
jgi:hypothetical protein